MILKFCTKLDRNGNRKGLIIDTVNSRYALDYNSWNISEYIEITATARRKLIAQLDKTGYLQVYERIG